jgi:hypothetical protein
MFDRSRVLRLLRDWAISAEADWYALSGERGCYGTGYNNWGVQTNQKYVTAVATLASCSEKEAAALGIERERWRERALQALRFSLDSHVSAQSTCTDGQKWGCTWISALGIERMMAGIHALWEHLTTQDKANLQHLLTVEADWLLHDYNHGGHRGISAGLWAHSGKNHPESNGWNGALLWRTAAMYPDQADAPLWRERAHEFLINAVSINADSQDETIVAGKRVRDRHIGANFFDDYALDHHGYLNVGYMVICVSGAAMLHADLKTAGLPRPESLDWHQADLWNVLRKLIFSNGRLARIGGDTRVRYAYCQEYLLPSLLYAAEKLGESHTPELIDAQLNLIEDEANFNGDGSFYSRRLQKLNSKNPYYYTRLESDRACALGLLLLNAPQSVPNKTAETNFEVSVAGGWQDSGHGAVVHRSSTRFASFSWHAFGLGQGICLPPDQGHMAEWEGNLGITARFMGDDGLILGGQTSRRRIIDHHTNSFAGGFLTYGTIEEGVKLSVPEGWNGTVMARSQIVFAALPDGHTVLGLQFCRTGNLRSFPLEVKGMRWRIPNDLYNNFSRTFITQNGDLALNSPCDKEEILSLNSKWINCEDKVGAVGLYGSDELTIHRVPDRSAGKLQSLYLEDVCMSCDLGARSVNANQILLDNGWAMLSTATAEQTRAFADDNKGALLDLPNSCRGVKVRAMDGKMYSLIANFGTEKQTLPNPFNVTLEVGEARLIY